MRRQGIIWLKASEHLLSVTLFLTLCAAANCLSQPEDMSTEVITLNVFTLHTVNNPSWKYLTLANSCHVTKMNKMYQQISVHIGWAYRKISPILYGKIHHNLFSLIYTTHALQNIANELHLFCFFMGTKINKHVRYNINKNQMHT